MFLRCATKPESSDAHVGCDAQSSLRTELQSSSRPEHGFCRSCHLSVSGCSRICCFFCRLRRALSSARSCSPSWLNFRLERAEEHLLLRCDLLHVQWRSPRHNGWRFPCGYEGNFFKLFDSLLNSDSKKERIRKRAHECG